MSILFVKALNQKKCSLKTQTIAAFFAVAASVIIPQSLHMLGAVLGIGTAVGEILLPMHFLIIFTGFLAGAYAGAISGTFAPLVSYLLTGMPAVRMLPFMMLELCAYGFAAGMLKNLRINTIAGVLIVQMLGRIVKALAIFTAVNVFSYEGIAVSSVWFGISKGILGIGMQLVLIPLMLCKLKNVMKND